MLPVMLLLAFLPGALWATEIHRPTLPPHDLRERSVHVYPGPDVAFGENSAFADLFVSEDVAIDSIRVEISITHGFDADVSVTLIAPDDTEVLLVNQAGGGQADFSHTVFSDAATDAIWMGTPPFTGTFLPMQPLSDLHGHDSRGVWRLWLQDNFPSADDGILTDWILTIIPNRGGYVYGQVLAAATEEPVEGAVVETGTGGTTETDATGHYSLYIREGAYMLRVGGTGWCRSDWLSRTMANGDSTRLDFSLHRPLLTVDHTSLSEVVPQLGFGTDTVRVENNGDCELIYTLADTATWLDATFVADTLAPGAEQIYVIRVYAGLLAVGDYQTNITIHHNGPGLDYRLPVDLYVVAPSGAADGGAVLPGQYQLLGNYPNPFNGETRIVYALPQVSDVRLEVFDVLGRRQAVLTTGMQTAGYHDARWDGAETASGVYLVKLTAGNFTATHKLLLVR